MRHLRRRAAVSACALVAALLGLGLLGRAATGVLSARPWWFEDDYTSLAYIDAAGTTAAVTTAAPGTVSLPPLPAAVAFDPAASVGLIASATGIRAWAFDGVAMVRAPRFDLAGTGYVGAAWIGRRGNQLAAATAREVTLAAWTGSRWTRVAALAVAGVTALAEGAPVAGTAASILVGTRSGFDVVVYRDGVLSLDAAAGVSDLTGAGGIVAAPGGSLVAVWRGGGVRVYGWDGSGYRETPSREVPAGPQRVVAAAWFRDGDGYWLLTAGGTLRAYGFDGRGVVRVPALGGRLARPVAALGTGWRQGDVAALVPGGWLYEDGAPLATDPARSVSGQHLAMYARSAWLQSTAVNVGHDVDEIQVDATVLRLPPGTALTYDVSTDGGHAWTPVAPCIDPTDPTRQCASANRMLPPGRVIVYRMRLSTTDPSVTPVVDATDLFEIATVVEARAGARAELIR